MNEILKRAIPFAKEFLECSLEYWNDEEYKELLKKIEEIEKNPNTEISNQELQDILSVAIEEIETNYTLDTWAISYNENMAKEHTIFVDEWNRLELLKN